MSYTPAQLRLLAASDRAESADRRSKRATIGRPRTAPDTPAQQRRRARAPASYYRRKVHAPPP